MKEYDVSVVVVCYNPDLSKLKRTLASVLLQTGVRVQIILADDGSANVYFPEIRSYFSAKNFGEYKLLGAEQNEGTCHNFYKGVTAASGVYIKGISPGDYLYEKDTLAKWVRFMENHQIDVCFGDAVFFREEEGGGIVALKRRYGTRPLRCDFYTLGEFNQHKACRSFFLLNDVVLGPKMIFKRKIVETYCAQLLGKIRYCEDSLGCQRTAKYSLVKTYTAE